MAPKTLASILNNAATRMEQHDFGSALNLYRQALAMAPTNGAAALGLAVALNRSGKPGEALELLQKLAAAINAAKPDAKPSAQQQSVVVAQIGLAHEQMGKLAEALEAYQQAHRLHASAELERRVKDIGPLASSPAPVQQLILAAFRQQANGDLDGAGKTLQAALQLHPDNSEALYRLAIVLRAQSRSQEAMPLLQKATMLLPDRPDYFNELGLVFQDRGDFSKAVSFHRRALNADPNFVSAHLNLGVALKRLGKLDESEAAYLRALQIDPRSPHAHNNLGNLLRVMGRLEDAKRHLQKALALRPGYAEAQANLDAVQAALNEQKANAREKKAAQPKTKTQRPPRPAAQVSA